MDSPFPQLHFLSRSLSFLLLWRAARGTGESNPICLQIFPFRASWSIWRSSHVRCFMNGENESPERAVICGIIKEQCLYSIKCRERETGKCSNWRQNWCGCWTLDNSMKGKTQQLMHSVSEVIWAIDGSFILTKKGSVSVLMWAHFLLPSRVLLQFMLKWLANSGFPRRATRQGGTLAI